MRRLRAFTALALLFGLVVGLATVPQTAMAATARVSGDECTRDGIVEAIDEAGDDGLVEFDCESPTIYFNSWIDIESTVTIDGSNNGNPIVLDGEYNSSFFEVHEGADLTVERMTLQNGYDTIGGAIYNSGGILTINQCTFWNNGTFLLGGAIVNDSLTTINQSSFVENYGVGFYSYGGAIDNTGTLTISQSSFIRNSANYAGAISNGGDGTLTVTSSTFADNYALYAASAFQIDSSTTIRDTTIMQPDYRSSTFWVLDSLTLSNVILAGESQHCSLETTDVQVSDDHTLASDDSCGLTGEGSHQNVTDLGLLPPETDSIDGVEQTYFLLAGDSPAVDGGAGCADVDQIGNARPYNFYCDIGAIESAFTTNLLCANQWNGQLSMASDAGCDRSEVMINMKTNGPLSLCVNQWNGATQVGDQCGRGEYKITLNGDQSVSLCVNRWTNAIRVSDRCSRSEVQEWF